MKIAYYIKKEALKGNCRIEKALDALRAGGVEVYDIAGGFLDGTEMLIAFGGDGTFLSAAAACACSSVPVLGVNLGRLGFLSDCTPEEVEDIVLGGGYEIENRALLEFSVSDQIIPFPFALNEVAVMRTGSGAAGIDVTIDGEKLPAYWADGLIVSTASGSTAYSLSVGGPICLPGVDAMILAPVAPHNLNLRPLVLPAGSEIVISSHNGRRLELSADNASFTLDAGQSVTVRMSDKPLKRVKSKSSSFIEALRSKLYWGEDMRNK